MIEESTSAVKKFKKQRKLYLMCVLQNGAIHMLNVGNHLIESQQKLFIARSAITDLVKSTKKNQFLFCADGIFGICELKPLKTQDSKFKLTVLRSFNTEGFISSIK